VIAAAPMKSKGADGAFAFHDGSQSTAL